MVPTDDIRSIWGPCDVRRALFIQLARVIAVAVSCLIGSGCVHSGVGGGVSDVGDDQGRVVSRLYRKDDGAFDRHVLHIYAEDGHLQRTVEQCSNGSTWFTFYAHSGAIVEAKQLGPESEVRQWYVRKYDGKGRVQEVTSKDGDGRTKIRRIFTYRDDGNVAEIRKMNDDGKLLERVVHEYSETGDWVQGVCYDSFGNVVGWERTPPGQFLYGEKDG